MNKLKLKITSHSYHHPDPPTGGEGSTRLVNCVDSSLSLRMTSAHFEFLIHEAK